MSTPSTSQPPHPPQQKDHLTILEEDDEFEEFPVEDWDDSDTSPRLWEDNWDDDDVEDEFSMQLRGELAKKKLTKDGEIPPVNVDAMQT